MERGVNRYIKAGNRVLNNAPEPHYFKLALELFKKAIELEPNNKKALIGLSETYHFLGKYTKADNILDQLLNNDPEALDVLFQKCIQSFPIIYNIQDEIQSSRANYGHLLNKLLELIKIADDDRLKSLYKLIGRFHPFYLAYQGLNDKDLQAKYGKLLNEITYRLHPNSQTLNTSPNSIGVKIKIGFFTNKNMDHAIWRVFLKGWIENLDLDKFDIVLYMPKTGNYKTPKLPSHIEIISENFGANDWIKQISKDRPDILIYPDFCGDKIALKLSNFRLAPVQCVAAGHCVTSGIPTMDYFISGQMLEPADGDAHYTESLIKLPNTSYFFEAPEISEKLNKNNKLGILSEAVTYFCTQNLFKYLPDYDDIIVEIAKKVKKCQFVFKTVAVSEEVADQFKRRIENKFSVNGLSPSEHLIFIDYLEEDDYKNFHGYCDIFLDSISYGGWTTIYEAIANDLPVVTLKGETLKGRGATGILTHIDVTETITNSIEEYISVAVNLGTDKGLRKSIIDRISKNKARAFSDQDSAIGFQHFLEKVYSESKLEKRTT